MTRFVCCLLVVDYEGDFSPREIGDESCHEKHEYHHDHPFAEGAHGHAGRIYSSVVRRWFHRVDRVDWRDAVKN